MFSYGEFLVWNNEAITIEKDMLFWKSWFKRNILFVQDILNADGNFITFEVFQNKFNIKTNYLHYFQWMAAIPSDLRKKARDSEILSQELLSNSTISLSSENLETEINFADAFTEWQTKFSYIYQSTRDNKWRQFSFRVLHRILTTKKELLKYRIASDETCIFCPNSHSVELLLNALWQHPFILKLYCGSTV